MTNVSGALKARLWPEEELVEVGTTSYADDKSKKNRMGGAKDAVNIDRSTRS